jgi:amidase
MDTDQSKDYDFARDIRNYLEALEVAPVRTLGQLIEYNKQHADIELPPGAEYRTRL